MLTNASSNKYIQRSPLGVLCHRAVAILDDIEIAWESNMFQTDPDRFLAVEYVKAFPAYAAATFSLAEGELVHRFLSLMRKTCLLYTSPSPRD